jgi:hypothetical protein
MLHSGRRILPPFHPVVKVKAGHSSEHWFHLPGYMASHSRQQVSTFTSVRTSKLIIEYV